MESKKLEIANRKGRVGRPFACVYLPNRKVPIASVAYRRTLHAADLYPCPGCRRLGYLPGLRAVIGDVAIERRPCRATIAGKLDRNIARHSAGLPRDRLPAVAFP